MHASRAEIGPPAELPSSSRWNEHEVVLTQLHNASAAEVDQGLNVLLQAVLATAHARHVSCALLDTNPCGSARPVFTQSVGLCPVDGAVPGVSAAASLAYEVRPGRRLWLDLSPARADQAMNLQSVLPLLQMLHRWLLWMDLSYGPVNDKGRMPPHHRHVLLLLLKGLSEKQIAAQLGQSIHTTHHYVKALYRRYGVRNRASLMAIWLVAAP